ncbi:hypothetical protein HYPSUDRAFT_144144 [Hypholoma sublateritium FD-334 SS-4]|uniref:Uncharacterized protein n=1 Tax=Hypholoma sublateritium (strain FD-334 SS-4) TaxID=945553 RepID=A0A0D2KWT8_HYPSF|nr:hypothetical protein HYPSUDRAFT_144144 [Hypholoma sublateritium FD-334 SS-4]
MPGGGYDFEDVFDLFLEASQGVWPQTIFTARDGTDLGPFSASEMVSEGVMLMDGFTLQDAMSALEIGEPRLDSGLIVEEQIRPPFDAMTLLLPEELCWILDRALAYETEFHAGNFLAHTIHTLLYVHHLNDIDPEIMPHMITRRNDPTRPLELVTIVLRAAVQGLLKCCDMAWRELARGGAYDTEDWQSDKCDVLLLEGMPVLYALSQLDEAIEWISTTSKVPIRWKVALRARLLLRKSLLQVMSTDPTKNRFDFQHAVITGKDHLKLVESCPPIDCEDDSPAQLAFDPYIGRRLQTATPIRVVPPPSFEDTCRTVAYFFDGLQEVGLLETVEELNTWQLVGDLRQWLPEPPLRVPYIRSLTQTTFYDGFLVLNKYSFEWLANRFFYETIGINYDWIRATVVGRWTGEEEPPLKKLEHHLYKLITPHFRALWYNPPRRRRHFMKAVVTWHGLYDILLQIKDNTDLTDLPHNHPLHQLPSAALLWRLAIVRDIVLSGVQLELYAPGERSFAYWYAAQVIDAHLEILDNMLPVVRKGLPIHEEMTYQIQLLTALQSLCNASALITMPLMTFDWDETRSNFFRRYKWAFRAEYDLFEAPDVVTPEMHRFIRACGGLIRDVDNPTPTESIELARAILTGLVDTHDTGGWAGLWAKDRMQLVHNLISVCDNLHGLPSTSGEMSTFDAKTLKWDPAVHPWFPSVKATEATLSG